MKSLVAVLALVSTSVFAQNRCMKSDEMFQYLKKEYGEAIVLIGESEQQEGYYLTVFANPKTGTGTVLKVSPNEGVACALETLRGTKIVKPIKIDAGGNPSM